MAQLSLDHNVSLKLAPLLEQAGHDVLTTRDIGGAQLTDDALLLASTQAGRVFITHNRDDFRMLHDAWVTWPAAFAMAFPTHPGILILDTAPVETLARVITDMLAELPAGRIANGIFWWHRHDGWRQPIGGAKWEPRRPSDEFGQE